MASIIKIKRSANPGAPSTLGQGEMAYSYASGTVSTLGDRLFIGTGTETGGNAATKSAIGGLYYTRLIDASTPGTLTTNANSVPVLSSTGTIDKWYAGNTSIIGNTISTTGTNEDLVLDPEGTGTVKINSYKMPIGPGTNGYILKTDGTDTASWVEPKVYIGSTAVDLFNTSGTVTSLVVDISGNAATANRVGNALTAGTDLSLSSGTTYDGSSALTLNVTSTLDSVTYRGNTTTNGVTIGRLTIGSAYSLPTTDGSSGYILATYGNGMAYWTSAGASPVQADWTQTDTGALDYIKNKPSLATVATSGSYNDLSDTPMLATVATSGSYNDLSDTPMLANVATSGDYNDLINIPETAAYLNVQGDSGTGNVSLLDDTLDFVGIGAISTVVDRVGAIVSVTTSIANATASTTGVASFSSSNFDITDAQVSIKTGGITNASLANSNVTIGSTTVNLGSTVTAFAGLTSLQIGNIKIYSDNQITTEETNGNINLITNGTGVIDVHNTRISSLADPEGPYDAVNRSYVDAVANGFHVHTPAQVATHANLATITGDTVTYDNGPLDDGVGATLTLDTAITIIDGITYLTDNFPDGSRILVKNEDNAAYNGIYTINTAGDVLTRATDFDTAVEVGGGDFVFVEHGDLYGSTGWVQVEDTDIIGTHTITFSQFAGVGTYKAGIGLYLDGTTFNANVNSSSGGIEIVANQFQLKSTIAGNGLTYDSGIISVGGTTDRISVSTDAIDISVNYVGQSSITTLGTITTGTWHGSTIGTGYGGTGFSSFNAYDLLVGNGSTGGLSILAKGSAGQLLQVNSAGTALEYADLDGGTY